MRIQRVIHSVFYGVFVVGICTQGVQAGRLPFRPKEPEARWALSTIPPSKAPLEKPREESIFYQVHVGRHRTEAVFVAPRQTWYWAPVFAERMRMRLLLHSSMERLYISSVDKIPLRMERLKLSQAF